MPPNTITLQEVVQWLETKPQEQVICWDTFEPSHSLLVQYDQEHGHHPHMRSEFDRLVSDPVRLDPLRGEFTGGEKHIIALFDQDLQKFNYGLHFTPLRFKPTVGALLEYYQRWQWQEPLRDARPYLPSDGEFNALHDSADRPEDLPWQHRERLIFRNESYIVILKVGPEQPYRQDLQYGMPRYVNLQVAIPAPAVYMQYQMGPRPPHTAGNYECQYDGWGYTCGTNLFDQDTITLTAFCASERVAVGTWQRQRERLIRIQ